MRKFQKEALKRAWAEINLPRLRSNFEKCRSLLPKGVEMMTVVKANAYGHGIETVIPCLENDCGVNFFAVSNLVEAIELRELGVSGEILILGYTPPKNAPELIEYDIIQAITERRYAEELSRCCPAGEKVRCHIAVDTGMTRIGIRGELSPLCDEAEAIYKLPSLSVEGLFTHLSVADSDSESDKAYTAAQIEKLVALKTELNRRFIIVEHLHFLNSAGAAYHPDPRGDLARFGIMLFGLKPNSALKLPVELEPVMELKAIVSQVKTVEPGVDVSYGRTYTTDKETKIAVVTIGYADGYPRLLSNKAEVLVRGKRAPIVGRVCMDQLMIDVTEVGEVCEGDVVTLFGKDGGESVSADELADMIGTIGYEIICGISPRVPRIAVDYDTSGKI